MGGPKPDPRKPYSRHRAGARTSGVSGLRVLPTQCDLPAPDLPPGRQWTDDERAAWAELWSSPQASQWDDSFAPVVALLVVYSGSILAGRGTAWMGTEARHLAERLGLTPTGLAANGWALPEQAPPVLASLHSLPGRAS
jgi:hypothetical protein